MNFDEYYHRRKREFAKKKITVMIFALLLCLTGSGTVGNDADKAQVRIEKDDTFGKGSLHLGEYRYYYNLTESRAISLIAEIGSVNTKLLIPLLTQKGIADRIYSRLYNK